MSQSDYDHSAACPHVEVTKMEFINREYPSIHGPSSEIWRVRCNNCGEVYEEYFIGE